MANIEQSLSILLPTLSHRLPTELVALSNSLLAQSRHHASNLKPEEEIARPYACSEIACKRVGAKLRLPTTVGRPPCPPRVYKKLLAFLERSLPASLPAKPSGQQSTPSKRKKQDDVDVRTPRQEDSTPRSSTRQSQRQKRQAYDLDSPTPKRRSTAFAGKVLGQRHRESAEILNDDGAPPWAMQTIRRLCRSFSVPSLPPHVYTGLCVVLKLASDSFAESDHDSQDRETVDKQRSKKRKDMTSLLTALFFMVRSRMQRGKLSTSVYLANCNQACAIVNDNDNEADSRPDSESQTTTTTKADVDSWIKTISSNHWANGQDWWTTVPQDVIDPPDLDPDHDLDQDDQTQTQTQTQTDQQIQPQQRQPRKLPTTKRSKGKGNGTNQDPSSLSNPQTNPSQILLPLLPGLATMLQDNVDYLSDPRKAQYKKWSAHIERRIERYLASRASDAAAAAAAGDGDSRGRNRADRTGRGRGRSKY